MFAQPFPESGRILVTLLAWEFFPLLGGKSAGRAVTELARWRSWQPVSSPWTVRGAVQFGATGRGHAGASRSAPSSAQALCSPSPSLPRGASSPCVVGAWAGQVPVAPVFVPQKLGREVERPVMVFAVVLAFFLCGFCRRIL
jgi:hypothetical protein